RARGVGPPTGGQLMSPVVRRLLGEYGLDASEVQGTGEGGRITRNDVLEAVSRRGQGAPAAAQPSAAPAPSAPSRPARPTPAAPAGPVAPAEPTPPLPRAEPEAAPPMPA